jgi:hypothetical protein
VTLSDDDAPLRERVLDALVSGDFDAHFVRPEDYDRCADAVLDALGLEQVGWRYTVKGTPPDGRTWLTWNSVEPPWVNSEDFEMEPTYRLGGGS